jgi:hypothetical protein
MDGNDRRRLHRRVESCVPNHRVGFAVLAGGGTVSLLHTSCPVAETIPLDDLLGLTEPDHGDVRLDRRQVVLLRGLAAHPGASIPAALDDESATEACYRFLRNPRVMRQAMIQPHIEETAAQPVQGSTLVVHDSTNISHAAMQDADDVYELANKSFGYVAHVSLAVCEDRAQPLGVVHLEVLEREKRETKRKRTKESLAEPHEGQRWARGAVCASEQLEGHDHIVHVMDSEGDSYATLLALVESGQDFVIRVGQSQRNVVGDADKMGISEHSAEVTTVARRSVHLGRRRAKSSSAASRGKGRRNSQSRNERDAELSFGASRVSVQQPLIALESWPSELELNVVRVWEASPPEGEEPVEWLLWTTLPIKTASEVLRVADIYRQRWLIEELFQVLKSGCRFEKRLFESKATSSRALALYLPIAVLCLGLRSLSRSAPDRPASILFDEDHLLALSAASKGKLPESPTIANALAVVARMGGHLRQNGAPGWRVLWRGMEKLSARAQGWAEARRHFTQANA